MQPFYRSGAKTSMYFYVNIIIISGLVSISNACQYDCISQETPVTVVQDETMKGPLRISDDGRWFVDSEGIPFFYLGDTAWELFHRLNREETDYYLKDRASKGFTVIQAVVLAELDGLNTPNPYGHTPLIDNDPKRPQEEYFQHVDYVVHRAGELGMYIGMLPTWGDKFNEHWGPGPEVFTPENARKYGEFIGNRYKDNDIIWILGGDRIPEDDVHLEIIRNMAEGIQNAAGTSQLMTYHPWGGSASWEWFHGDEWLDFNMHQSGHDHFDIPNYDLTLDGYSQAPVKPVLDSEPRYEDHPVNWDPEEGWFLDFDVRQAAYWSMLSGAAGHTYGNHNIWQMWQLDRNPVSSARTPWWVALDHIGSTQMGYMRNLFESRPYQRLVPDQSVIIGDTKDGAAHIRAARASDGSFLFVYTPYGRAFTVDMTKIGGERVNAYWFNPRSEMVHEIGLIGQTDRHSFDPPGDKTRGNDWVLVLDNAELGFRKPVNQSKCD